MDIIEKSLYEDKIKNDLLALFKNYKEYCENLTNEEVFKLRDKQKTVLYKSIYDPTNSYNFVKESGYNKKRGNGKEFRSSL